MIASTTALELLQTLLIVLGALGIVGSVCFASALTSIKHTETSHELRMAEAHEAAETERHKATLAKMREVEIEVATREIERRHEEPLVLDEKPRRRLRRAL